MVKPHQSLSHLRYMKDTVSASTPFVSLSLQEGHGVYEYTLCLIGVTGRTRCLRVHPLSHWRYRRGTVSASTPFVSLALQEGHGVCEYTLCLIGVTGRARCLRVHPFVLLEQNFFTLVEKERLVL